MKTTLKVRIKWIDDVLGSTPGDPQIHETYIASKAPDAMSIKEEIEAVGMDEVIAKGKTIFPKVDGEPVLWSYQVRGFFKSACAALKMDDDSESSKVTAYKKLIDRAVFVFPDADDRTGRAIRIHTDEPISDCPRSLRASTPQGERTAIADSERISQGAWADFDVVLLTDKIQIKGKTYLSLVDLVKEWLDYGEFCGIGQWRSSGKGAFVWEERE